MICYYLLVRFMHPPIHRAKSGKQGEWLVFQSHGEKDRPVLAKIISGLPDKMSGRLSILCRTFWSSAGHFYPLMTSKYDDLCRTFAGHFPCIEPCRTKCPAMFEPPAGHQQKSAGHVQHVRHISRGLDRPGISHPFGSQHTYLNNSPRSPDFLFPARLLLCSRLNASEMKNKFTLGKCKEYCKNTLFSRV